MPELSVVPAAAITDLRRRSAASPSDEAHERGVDEGREQMKRELASKVDDAVNALGSAAQALTALRQSCLREMEEHVFVLSLAVAQHIIDRDVSTDEKIIRDITMRALEHVSWDTTVDIRLHPEDLETVRRQFDAESDGATPDCIEWVEDAAVGRGGCIVENDDQRVDSSLDTALKNVYEHLTSGTVSV